MKQSITGIVIGIILLFVSSIILPVYFMGIITYRDDLNKCQVAARNFVDMIIDNGQINDRAISDLNLQLASCTSTFSYRYYREEKVIQPVAGGGYETTWMHVECDENTQWNSGDIVTIVIEQEGINLYQRIAHLMPGASFTTQEIRMSGMVR